jgi:hypothetical protein
MSLDAMKQAYVALHNAYEGRLKTGEMLRAMTALRHAIYEVDAVSPTPIEDWPRQWQGLTEDEKNAMVEWAHPDIIDAIELKLKERNT